LKVRFVLAAALVLVAGGCSTPAVQSDRTSAVTRAFDTEDLAGAKAAVDRLQLGYRQHDAVATWQSLTAAGQSTMTQDDYAQVAHACPSLFTDEPVRSITINSADTVATVTAAAAQGGTYTFQMIYESGRWKHQPSAGALTWMSMTAGEAITYLKLNDAC
jgi:hypothetical protein